MPQPEPIRIDPISPASPAWAAFTALLEAERLPADDLGDAGQRFFAALDGADAVGFGGLQFVGRHALLRSVVVAPTRRGRGDGVRLAQGLVGAAREAGAADLWLLTTTARGFFERLGFMVRPRQDAPAAVAGTREFSALCPASAALMQLKL